MDGRTDGKIGISEETKIPIYKIKLSLNHSQFLLLLDLKESNSVNSESLVASKTLKTQKAHLCRSPRTRDTINIKHGRLLGIFGLHKSDDKICIFGIRPQPNNSDRVPGIGTLVDLGG
jgi:hypothetical protein